METQISIYREILWNENTFKYLGATLAENEDLDAEMTHRIQSGLKKLEEGIGDSVRPKNKLESQEESIQDSCNL